MSAAQLHTYALSGRQKGQCHTGACQHPWLSASNSCFLRPLLKGSVRSRGSECGKNNEEGRVFCVCGSFISQLLPVLLVQLRIPLLSSFSTRGAQWRQWECRRTVFDFSYLFCLGSYLICLDSYIYKWCLAEYWKRAEIGFGKTHSWIWSFMHVFCVRLLNLYILSLPHL